MALSVDNVSYRQGKFDDIQQLYHICRASGWPVPHSFVKDFYESCPQAFIVAEHNNVAIGHCVGDILNEDEAFICIFKVDDKYQRRGIGGALFRRCLEALGDRNVTLYATPVGAPYYKKHFGFKPTAEESRMGRLDVLEIDAKKLGTIEDPDASLKLVPLKEFPFEHLEEYDTKIHVVNRRKHLQKFPDFDGAVAALVNNQLVGYGCLYICHKEDNTYVLGPVFADTPQYAMAIFKSLLTNLPEKTSVSMMYFEDNKDAIAVSTKLGANNTARFPTLYTKHGVDVAMEKIYCVANTMNAFA